MRLEIQAYSITKEALPGGGSYVARLNFKTPRVCVYKCLSLIDGFAVTVAIWPREVVSCRDFILHAVVTFWAMALVGVYPCRTSRARSIQPNFPEISVQNSMDRFGPTGKVSKKQVHLLRWSSFPGRTGLNVG